MNQNTKSKRTIKSQVMGPVDNLEKHLQPDWWKKIFNAMYLKTDADVVEDTSITKSEIDLFQSVLKLQPEMAVLDLACGQGRHVLELARRGFKNVNGLDRSYFLIRRAKSIASAEGLSATFKEGDARKLPFATDSFDVITILGNSFGYFENPEDDIKILNEVFRILKPGGQFLLDITDGDYIRANYSPRSWEWIDNKHFVCRERSLSENRERLISREVVTNINKGVIVDQFYAERLYSAESIKGLLESRGFKKIEFHGNLKPDSKRNQDLGMMEQRIIVSSSVIKEWTPAKVKSEKSKNVVVIMGDPNKKDVIKPDAVFDSDDYNTIDQLKIALSSLKNFQFTYLNNHNTLLTDLAKIQSKTDFVLNLCDEGFDNDAKLELHVPAALEMMKIPYTGSNPQCLAYCYDKSLIRGIAQEMDVPVAKGFYIKPEDNIFEFPLTFPVIAKPNFGDSSFGVTTESVALTIEELNNAILKIRKKFGYEKPILVEEFLTGKELTIGLIGNPPDSYKFLPIIEEDFSDLPPELPKICGYEAKWLEDSPYFKLLKSVPANLSPELERTLYGYCLKMAERLECRDYTRFDWRLDSQGNPKLLEVNPNPGWCWDGHLAKMSAIAGSDYAEMLRMILESAEKRIFEYAVS